MITETSQIRLRRPVIEVLIFGQSVEQGAGPTSDQAAYPTAFKSAFKAGVAVPFGPSISRGGAWWPGVYDDLYAYGYDLRFVNAAIGSMSFLRDATNWLQGRNNNWTQYNQYRAPSGVPGDRGDMGDFILVGERVFQCVQGRSRYAVNQSQFLSGNGLALSNGITYSAAVMTTAATQPAGLTTANVGDIVTDGDDVTGVKWKCLTTTKSTNSPWSTMTTSVMTSLQYGYGFDPLGLIQRASDSATAVRDAEKRLVYIQNGQGDFATSAATYGNTLISLSDFFLLRNFDAMIGLSSFSPGLGSTAVTGYDNLTTGRATALTTQKAAYAGRVFDGPNLYQLMGTTGPMGGSGFTGAVASNVLTVSASSYGAIAVGQTIAKADGTIIGTVASLGTGTGGTGTYNLTGGVDTASQTMRASGAWLQAVDNVHLNGAGLVGPAVGGVSSARVHVGNALKAMLPQLVA